MTNDSSNPLRLIARGLKAWVNRRRYWRESAAELEQRLNAASTLDGLIDAVWNYKGRGPYSRIRPLQAKSELRQLLQRVADLQPKRIIELGTRNGGTLALWTRCAPSVEHVVSVDLPGGIFGGGYPTVRVPLYRAFAVGRPHTTVTLLRQDSQTEATRDAVARAFADQPVDFLFIDADHREAGVRRDYALYAPLVRRGGLIAFHDIRPDPDHPDVGVYKLWDELKASNPTAVEYVKEPYRGHYGIGVIEKVDE
ncbi:MAG: class I SAM-dependent methyltransferase [Chloroflexi bacterium]|nr:class I SAM-dependent methyltransferase [Chloroflexota bacterium]